MIMQNENTKAFISSNVILQIFAKIPEKGKVKTRLAGQSSEAFALAVAKASLLRLSQKAMNVWPGKTELWLANTDALPHSNFIQKLVKDNPSIRIKTQCQGNLGEKMLAAMKEANNNHHQAVIIGADIPHISEKTLLKAHAIAQRKQSFIGPCEDGGYYMISSAEPHAHMFNHVDWGSENSFAQTIKAWQAASNAEVNSFDYKATPTLLDSFFDIDFMDDVEKARRLDKALDTLIKQCEAMPDQGNF